MNELDFEKQGAYWVSSAFSGGESGSVVLHLDLPKSDGVNSPNIIVQSTADEAQGWSDRWNGRWGGKIWEQNVVGIAPFQKIRLLVSVEPYNGQYKEY